MSTTQTVRGAIDSVAIRAKADKEAMDKAKTATPTFHQQQIAAKAKDPENQAYQNALIDGETRAAVFLQTVRDPNHPDHEKNLAIFKNQHNADPRNVVKDFQARACSERGAASYETRDPAYEQNVLKPYRPTGNTTPMQLDFFSNMQKALQDKWNKSGYKGDKSFIDGYAAKYGLERNERDAAMQNIRARS